MRAPGSGFWSVLVNAGPLFREGAESTSLIMQRTLAAALFLTLVAFVPAVQAQVTALTADSTSFKGLLSLNAGGYLSDPYDFGNQGLDPSKQSGLNGSSTMWDLVGNSTKPLVQVGLGTFTGTLNTSASTSQSYTNASAVYFRVRLADYQVQTGSVVVLFNNGAQSFGFGAQLGNTGSNSNKNGVYYITPNAGTTLTAGFQYSTTQIYYDAGAFNYSTVTAIDGANGPYAGEISTVNTRLDDAYLTFVVLNSNLVTPNGTPFAVTNNTQMTVFTNNNSQMNGNINADYLSFNATGNSNTNPLEFGSMAIPEPSTWISSGVMLLGGGLMWWRRRRRIS